ncbi:MAG TPA: hypothetical protein VKS78_15020 [Roseiarcus sp.]|nr:hypothetical protein [Roseiarcus sp.]
MITAVRSVQATPGKFTEAMAFAKEIAAYIKSKHGLELEIKTQVAGAVGRIAWVANYDSLAAYEATWNKINADPDIHKLTTKVVGVVVPGHSHDSLWRSA